MMMIQDHPSRWEFLVTVDGMPRKITDAPTEPSKKLRTITCQHSGTAFVREVKMGRATIREWWKWEGGWKRQEIVRPKPAPRMEKPSGPTLMDVFGTIHVSAGR